MVECEICGTSVSGGSAFTCSYCGGTFCPSHRLPFNHACPRIEDWRSSKPEKVKKTREREKELQLLVKQRSIIAGAVIGLFLVIMAIWFFKVF